VANRPTEVHDPLNDITTTSYDRASNATRVTDAVGQPTQYAFDGRNRPVAVTDPLGHTAATILDADGRAAATVDALGDVSRTGYDGLGRPVVAVDGRGAATQTIYDPDGHPALVVDPVGNPTSFVYNALGQEVLRTDPNGNATATAYDVAHRATAVTDRIGRQVQYSYDLDDRATTVVWLTAPGGTALNTLTYGYDPASNLTLASDRHGSISFSYDQQDRPTAQTDVFGLTLTALYDPADRRTQVQDPFGGAAHPVTAVYDAAGRLTSRQFSDGTNTVRVDLGYSARDELTGISRYNSLTAVQANLVGATSYGYDAASRVTSVAHKNGTGATLSYYSTSYDNADRATSDTGPSGTRTYTYDAADQLLTDGTSTYSYDLAGNRTRVVTTTMTYQYQPPGPGNRLTSDGQWNYSYDAEGNLIGKQAVGGPEVWTYGYDNLNHLTSVVQMQNGTATSLWITYTYDALGDRVQQDKWQPTTGTVTTEYAYDGANVWADLDSGSHLQVRYLYGDGVDQPLARIVASGPNAGVAAYLTDRLGSVRDLMSWSSQTVIDHLDYDGYGQVSETAPTVGDRFKYAAGEADRDTGLVRFNERYYDTKTGRWTSEDPLGLGPDSNPYRYVYNSATNALDPSGLKTMYMILGQTPPPAPPPPRTWWEQNVKDPLDNNWLVQWLNNHEWNKAGNAWLDEHLWPDWASRPTSQAEFLVPVYGNFRESVRQFAAENWWEGCEHFFLALVDIVFLVAGEEFFGAGEWRGGPSLVWAPRPPRMGPPRPPRIGIGPLGPGRPPGGGRIPPVGGGMRPRPPTQVRPPARPTQIAPPGALPPRVGMPPQGARIIQTDPHGAWVIFEDATGVKKIQFDVTEASNLAKGPLGPGRGTLQTGAAVGQDGKVVVVEGMHRLEACKGGAQIAPGEGGIPGLPGWLEFNLWPP
jgi:RHS repeat-associated protein